MGSKRRIEIMCLCDRCLACDANGEEMTLYDLAHLDDRSVANLMNESRYKIKGLQEKACDYAKQRVEKARESIEAKTGELCDMRESFSVKFIEQLAAGGDLDKLLDEYLGDKHRMQLEEEVTALKRIEEAVSPEDIAETLNEYVEKDLIEVSGDGVKITPQGSKRLAKYVLRRIWENLSASNTGANTTSEEGFGVTDGFGTRKYEYGDEFYKIDLEATLLSALENGRMGPDRIEFSQEDLLVKETMIDTSLCIGLIVDESGSMSGDKIHAAMDISLALSETVKRNAKDKLKLFLFSNQVRELSFWDLVNTTFSGGMTDIRSALRRFRTSVVVERADKQVYLITDTEPNSEDGQYIGFQKAMPGVLREAIMYQREGITLNIIMLDNTPHLREFASVLAKRNLGRVFFSEPKDLGSVLMEDYLRKKKGKKLRKSA